MSIRDMALMAMGMLAFAPVTMAVEPEEIPLERLSCTSIMVGKKASADGSVMTSHTCDGRYRTWMNWVPASDNKPGATTDICKGLMRTETAESKDRVEVLGKIPQVEHTYRFLNTAYPCINEKILAMGETTIGGRDTLQNADGLFYIEELQRIALQRCTSARQAIRLMGDLVREYGYADGGECLTIADTSEVWIFEVFGEGPKKKGGVWAAQRIPDDEIAVSANISRIGQIDVKDTMNFMASDNVFSVARKLKLWDGKEPFSFWRAYSGLNYMGEAKNYSTREFFIMNSLAPSLHLSADAGELPVSVKPDTLVSVEDVNRLLSSYYEGTEDDYTTHMMVPGRGKKKSEGEEKPMMVSPLANPWMQRDERELYAAMGDSTFCKWIRPVAVAVCAYSTVIQLFSNVPEPVGGVVWMSLDNPAESPRMPIYCGSTKLPEMLSICGNHTFREDAALWRFRRTNRMATLRWGECRKSLEPARDYFLAKGVREIPYVRSICQELLKQGKTYEATDYLNGYTSDFLGAELLRWDELYTSYWKRFWSGF